MHIPGICLTCGNSIGHVVDIFLRKRCRLIKEALKERGVVVNENTIRAAVSIDCSLVFEEIKIHNDCCRKTLSTSLIYIE